VGVGIDEALQRGGDLQVHGRITMQAAGRDRPGSLAARAPVSRRMTAPGHSIRRSFIFVCRIAEANRGPGADHVAASGASACRGTTALASLRRRS
jgi:hypothetical protein